VSTEIISEETTPRSRPSPAVWALIAALVVLFAGSFYLLWQVRDLKAQLSEYHETIAADLSSVREMAELNKGRAQQDLEALRQQLEEAQKQASTAVGKAKTEAQKHAEKLAQDIARRQQALQEQVASEFNQVKQAADQTSARITEVSTDVNKVDTRVSETKAELDKTIADLQRVNGDMGVMSGLIATNAQEVAALRELGERNYFEFQLGRTKQPQKVGEISLRLKKTDIKRNKYTMDVFADDKRIEKKDKTANEPVQFYVAGARQPYEIVVYQVEKGQIVGYLSTPKVVLTQARGPKLQ
jgi:F0F1-type ATP synthase membrane subunit b/b'